MVRTPCCEKMGLKRGPWSPEEDHILISYIQKYGHSNWRALPKQAGLLRCGKSCRLRWTNYLRPDIKRGNFTKEEEDTIINLHKVLGNRWSAIAARLPGRTDNEIKNVWHTHLKKRLMTYKTIQECKIMTQREQKPGAESKSARANMNSNTGFPAVSPAQSDSTDFFCLGIESSSTACTGDNRSTAGVQMDSMGSWDHGFDQEIDESFWAEIFSMNSCDVDSMAMEGSASGPMASFFSTDSANYENDKSFCLMNFMQAGEFYGLLEI